MTLERPDASFPVLQRLPTRVPGLDAVLHGGLLVGNSYLIIGKPGTGKTTLGNQLAFAHAAAGGTILVATLLTESHDRMLAHMGSFRFVDRSLVGARIHYISLLNSLQEGNFDGMMRALVETMRNYGPTLLIIDGAGAARTFASSEFDYAGFIQALQARTALFGCTSVLLTGERESESAATHVDGVVELVNAPVDARDARWLHVIKLRGSRYLDGHHRFAIGDEGITVFPRLEAAFAELEPAWPDSDQRLAFGVPGLDAMISGGVMPKSSALLLGTPGAGKTILGLHFLAEGARQGEPGLIAAFQETATGLAATAERAGLGLGPHLESGLVRVLWQSPLELAPDQWAWQLLATIDAHGSRRLVVDAFSDLFRLFVIPKRQTHFAQALVHALRDRGVTTIFVMEIDALTGPELALPVPNLSAAMDSGILLRTVELRSELRRILSILKMRQTAIDPTMRELVIGPGGMTVGDPIAGTALLTGTAVPSPGRD